MLRPSEYLAKLEDRLVEKLGPWFEREIPGLHHPLHAELRPAGRVHFYY